MQKTLIVGTLFVLCTSHNSFGMDDHDPRKNYKPTVQAWIDEYAEHLLRAHAENKRALKVNGHVAATKHISRLHNALDYESQIGVSAYVKLEYMEKEPYGYGSTPLAARVIAFRLASPANALLVKKAAIQQTLEEQRRRAQEAKREKYRQERRRKKAKRRISRKESGLR